VGTDCDGLATLWLLLRRWRLPAVVVAEPPVEALNVGEDALPVRLLHPHHVVNLQQRADVGIFLCSVEGQREVVASVCRVQGAEVESLGVKVVNQSAEGKTVVPTSRKVSHIHLRISVDSVLDPGEDNFFG